MSGAGGDRAHVRPASGRADQRPEDELSPRGVQGGGGRAAGGSSDGPCVSVSTQPGEESPPPLHKRGPSSSVRFTRALLFMREREGRPMLSLPSASRGRTARARVLQQRRVADPAASHRCPCRPRTRPLSSGSPRLGPGRSACGAQPREGQRAPRRARCSGNTGPADACVPGGFWGELLN